MRAGSRYLAALILLAALLLGACGETEDALVEDDPPATASGVITAVEPAEGAVKSFVVDDETEGSVKILIADDIDYGFDLAHLREHMESGDPVAVDIEDRDGAAYALSIEDI